MLRRSVISVFLVFLAALVSSCKSSPNAPSDPATLTLAPGASGTVGTLKVTFVRVTGDSRCPGDALCITAGDAQVALETTYLGAKHSNELALVAAAKRAVQRGTYTITFDALTPYPFASLGPVAPSAYRATFKVERK